MVYTTDFWVVGAWGLGHDGAFWCLILGLSVLAGSLLKPVMHWETLIGERGFYTKP